MPKKLTLKDLRNQLISTKGQPIDKKIAINLHNDNIQVKMVKLRKQRHREIAQKVYVKQIKQELGTHNLKNALDIIKKQNNSINQILKITEQDDINKVISMLRDAFDKNNHNSDQQ